MELNLLDSPLYDVGGLVTSAVAGRTQTFFKVQRVDVVVTSISDPGGGNMTINFLAIATAPTVGQFCFVDLTSVNQPLEPFEGRSVVVASSTTHVEISTGFLGSVDYLGLINFINNGIYEVTVEFQVAKGLLPSYFVKYSIPYQVAEYSFDIHAYLESIFSQYPNTTVFEYDAIIEVVSTSGGLVGGTAKGTYTITSFRNYLPRGYEFGQNLVGYIQSEIERGRFATAMQNGYLFVGYDPLLYTISDDPLVIKGLLKLQWIDINNTTIGATTDEQIDIKQGINVVTIGLDLTPPENATKARIWVTNDLGTSVIIKVITLTVYRPLCNPVQLQWRNRLGGIDTWVFDKDFDGSVIYNTNLKYQNTRLTELSESSRGTHSFNVKQLRRITLGSRNIPYNVYRTLIDLFYAEFIWVNVNDVLIPVSIVGNTPLDYTATQAVNYSLGITIEFPPDFTDETKNLIQGF